MGFTINGETFTYTNVPNSFIEEYMPSANGEFVKVYLYLLRCATVTGISSSVCTVADALSITEKDVIRALKYWENQGLVDLAFDEDGSLMGVSVAKCTSKKAAQNYHIEEAAPAEPAVAIVSTPAPKKAPAARRSYTKEEVERLSETDEVSQLLYVATRYLNRPLRSSDTDILLFLNQELGLSGELCEYLIEYCLSGGHKSLHYMEQVGISWAEQGISDIEGAKALFSVSDKNARKVLRAFGVTDRTATEGELDFIERWTITYGFGIEAIVEACKRTIDSTHKVSFSYAEAILKNWRDKGAFTLDAVNKLDEEHKSNTEIKHIPVKAASGFSNFTQHSYDFEALEKKLLSKN